MFRRFKNDVEDNSGVLCGNALQWFQCGHFCGHCNGGEEVLPIGLCVFIVQPADR